MYHIVVYGSPAPQGSKKFLGTFTGKDGRTHAKLGESSAKVKPWRLSVQHAALEMGVRIAGPVSIELIFTMPKPKSAPKKRITWPDRKPDIDKLCRSTLDGLVESGIIEDDARVVRLTSAKVFPNEGVDSLAVPGCLIRITAIHATQAQSIGRTASLGLPEVGQRT